MEPFYVIFFISFATLQSQSPSVSVVSENAVTLFCCEAPERFVGL